MKKEQMEFIFNKEQKVLLPNTYSQNITFCTLAQKIWKLVAINQIVN